MKLYTVIEKETNEIIANKLTKKDAALLAVDLNHLYDTYMLWSAGIWDLDNPDQVGLNRLVRFLKYDKYSKHEVI